MGSEKNEEFNQRMFYFCLNLTGKWNALNIVILLVFCTREKSFGNI